MPEATDDCRLSANRWGSRLSQAPAPIAGQAVAAAWQRAVEGVDWLLKGPNHG